MNVTGIAHTAFGFAALVLGVGILSLAKGTDLHCAVGALYALSMFGLNVTALLIYHLFGGFGPFHVFALINLALVLAGFGVVLLKRPRKGWPEYHYNFMSWSYVGLVAAAVSEITGRVLGSSAVAVAVATVAVTVPGGVLIWLRERQTLAQVRGSHPAA